MTFGIGLTVILALLSTGMFVLKQKIDNKENSYNLSETIPIDKGRGGNFPFGPPDDYFGRGPFWKHDDLNETFERMMEEMRRMHERMQRDFPRAFDDYRFKQRCQPFIDRDFFGGPFHEPDRGGFYVRMDVEETDTAYIVRCDLPGMEKETINITLEDNVITIEGERETKTEEKDSKGNIIYRERSYGAFSRSFTLPENVKPEKIKSTYEKGVLTINIPKAESRKKPKTIKIGIDPV